MFFECTIMGNTADLAMVQKTIIDTLHKEDKSQRVITERGGCSKSAVSIKCKVDWKEEIGWEKVHKQQGWLQAGEYGQAKPIQTLWRVSQGVNWSWSQCIKSHHAQIFRKRATKPFLNRINVRRILPGLRRKITGLLLSGPKSSFQIKVLHFVWKSRSGVWRKSGEAHNPCCLKSSEKFLKSVMIWGPVTSAGVGPLCCIKFHLLTSFIEMLISFSSRNLAPAHTAKTPSKWFADHDTVLDWPANMPDLNPIENLWDIFKRKMRNSRSNNTDKLKAQ